MLLTISTTRYPATDLGYVLHKHPDKLQTLNISCGKAHIFYPEAGPEKTTICLLLEIDPIELVRGRRNQGGESFSLDQYVNDRPYVASSFLSVALIEAFSTAMNGRCKDKPELVDMKFPFEAVISVLPASGGGEALIRKFFEPLDYEVFIKRHDLDLEFPEWGESKYYSVTLKATITAKELLSHLYVLIPALDRDKHYFVDKNEIDKLLKKGEGWLKTHPEKEQITKRYLVDLKHLSRKALERLKEDDETSEAEPETQSEELTEEQIKKESLNEKRIRFVLEKTLESGAERVLDLGCGEGRLLRHLLKQKQFSFIAGVDVSYSELLKAKERLKFEELPRRQKEKIQLFQGSLMYRDDRLKGFDAATVVEVIEHLEANRLSSFERVLFEFARPRTIVLTTPNREYNVLYEKLPQNSMRHHDHRFEWSREEFGNWAESIRTKFGYEVEFFPVGDEDETVGAPTQMAVFTLGD